MSIFAISLTFLTLFTLSSAACTNNSDCQLNGVCVQNACQCDSGWEGDQCGVLSLVPASAMAGFRQNDSSSWGGTILVDPNDKTLYHLFASEMADHCNLGVWRSNSQIVHAVSKGDPTGPYSRIETVIKPEAHNPQAVRAPDGTYILFDSYGGPISCPTKTVNCQSTQYCPCTQPGPGPLTFHIATSPNGPWSTYTTTVPYPCYSCNLTPAPLIHPNGTLFILFHCDPDSTHAVCDLTMVKADNWRGPYEMVNGGAPVWLAREAPGHPEDPYFWIDKRGGWHAIMHNGPHGLHVYSMDGEKFVTANNNKAPFPFTTDIPTVGGTVSVNRRERPWMMFDGDRPVLLVTSVDPNGDGNTFTHVQAIKTK